jgi:chromosome segregation ATPase
METAGRDVPGLLQDLKKAATLLEGVAERTDKLLADERIDRGLTDAAAAAEDLREATDELPETAEELRNALKNASRVIARQEDDIRALVRELQSISRNLNRLSEEVSRNPSQLLFGDPPPEWEDVEE